VLVVNDEALDKRAVRVTAIVGRVSGRCAWIVVTPGASVGTNGGKRVRKISNTSHATLPNRVLGTVPRTLRTNSLELAVDGRDASARCDQAVDRRCRLERDAHVQKLCAMAGVGHVHVFVRQEDVQRIRRAQNRAPVQVSPRRRERFEGRTTSQQFLVLGRFCNAGNLRRADRVAPQELRECAVLCRDEVAAWPRASVEAEVRKRRLNLGTQLGLGVVGVADGAPVACTLSVQLGTAHNRLLNIGIGHRNKTGGPHDQRGHGANSADEERGPAGGGLVNVTQPPQVNGAGAGRHRRQMLCLHALAERAKRLRREVVIFHLTEHVAPTVRRIILEIRRLVRKQVASGRVGPPVVVIERTVRAEAVDVVHRVAEGNLLPVVPVLVVHDNVHRSVRVVSSVVAVVVAHVVVLANLNASLQQVDGQLALAHVELAGLVHVDAAERAERLGAGGQLHARSLLAVVRNGGAERGVQRQTRRENPHGRTHAVAAEARLVLLVEDLEPAEVLLDNRKLHHLALAELVPRRADHRVTLLPLALVLATVQDCRNHVVVVRLLHRLRDLLDVQQVLAAALVGRHKTVLQHKGQTVTDSVVLASLLARGDQTRDTFLWHDGRQRLVETELVPRHVDLVSDLDREAHGRIPVVSCIQKPLNSVANEDVLALVRVGERVRLVLCENKQAMVNEPTHINSIVKMLLYLRYLSYGFVRISPAGGPKNWCHEFAASPLSWPTVWGVEYICPVTPSFASVVVAPAIIGFSGDCVETVLIYTFTSPIFTNYSKNSPEKLFIRVRSIVHQMV